MWGRTVYFFRLEEKEAHKIKPRQIYNECIEKAPIQLTGVVMEVDYLLKCLVVVLVFFGLAILVKIWWCASMYQKINDENKDICWKKNMRPRCGRYAALHWAHDRRIHKSGRTLPHCHPKLTKSRQNECPFEVVRWSCPQEALNSACQCHSIRS